MTTLSAGATTGILVGLMAMATANTVNAAKRSAQQQANNAGDPARRRPASNPAQKLVGTSAPQAPHQPTTMASAVRT